MSYTRWFRNGVYGAQDNKTKLTAMSYKSEEDAVERLNKKLKQVTIHNFVIERK